MTDHFEHESAYVDEDVDIGPDTKIWHFCHLMDGCSIGAGSTLGQNVFVGRNVEIGANVKIQNNVSVYEGVTLKEGVFCGPSVVFTNDLTPRAEFPIESSAYDETIVERGATLGANATIVCGTTIGEWAFVGAGAVVTQDVPPYALVYGSPAEVKGWACRCGKPLPEDDEPACDVCGREYRVEDGPRLRYVGGSGPGGDDA